MDIPRAVTIASQHVYTSAHTHPTAHSGPSTHPCILQAFATFDRDCKGYLSRLELRTMLCRCGLRGSETELSTLRDAMVRKGSRGLTYFDMKKFLESYDHTQRVTRGDAAKSDVDADRVHHSTQVCRVAVFGVFEFLKWFSGLSCSWGGKLGKHTQMNQYVCLWLHQVSRG